MATGEYKQLHREHDQSHRELAGGVGAADGADGQRREVLSALLDGEGDALVEPGGFSDECVSTWGGYCLVRSVLRGEYQNRRAPAAGMGEGLQAGELAERVRAALLSEPPAADDSAQDSTFDEILPATLDDPGQPPPRRRQLLRGRPMLPTRLTDWRRAARQRPARFGTAVALGAAAISVVIGVSTGRDGPATGPAVASMTALGATQGDTLVLSDFTVPDGGALPLVAVEPSAESTPRRPGVQRVVAAGWQDQHGQLPYYLAHANASASGYQAPGVMLVPIAGSHVGLPSPSAELAQQ